MSVTGTSSAALRWVSLVVAAATIGTERAAAQSIPADALAACEARAIGPAAPGGRIVDVEVHPDRPWEIWAASASGGVWKSVNNGTTWSCAFDRALSIGDVAIAETNPDVIWIGTGEGNNQRSSYAGNGVWRSIDGGKTFEHLGLADSHHIGRVVVSPEDCDVAYVAALGHLYSRNDERGLFKTIDGGATWEKVLHLGDSVSVADVVLDPVDPDTVWAASYVRLRRAWNFEDVGASAIYKSIDGGTSWRRLEGGLPAGNLGRIGLTLLPGDSDVLYACIDNQNPAASEGAEPPEGEPRGARTIGGEIWRTQDGGRTWEKRNEQPVSGQPPYYYGQIRVDPHDSERVWLLGIPVFVSKDGGRTFSQGEVARSLHSDHHALWFDPVHEGRLLLGNDGGLAQSYDGGATWDWFDHLPIAQLYTVSVDTRRPYWVYGGLQDNGVWAGPSRSRSMRGAGNDEWRFIGGGDGMYVLADPEDPDTVYLEMQFGAIQRTNVATGESRGIRPPPSAEGARDRYNWCAPIVVSSHNSKVIYFGAQCLWKSLDRGDHWKAVSGDVTTNDPERVKGNVPHCTITTIAESTLDPDLLLVGTDDGNVQWTEDGGHTWTDCSGRFPGLPPRLWVSRVELSPHDRKSAWVTFSGYREDDFTPWVFRTRDGGATFEPIGDGLPPGPSNVIRESPRRAGTLFLGSDGGAFFSIDGGGHWQPLARGLPVVSVLDLAVHPRESDVVLATHGRGFYVVDVRVHEQIDADVLSAKAHLFQPSEAVAWRTRFGAGWNGERQYLAPNPEPGSTIWYWLGSGDQAPVLEVLDATGAVVRKLETAAGEGLHRANWDLRRELPREEPSGEAGPTASRDAESPSPPQGRRGRFGRGPPPAQPGTYRVRLSAGETVVERELVLAPDPDA